MLNLKPDVIYSLVVPLFVLMASCTKEFNPDEPLITGSFIDTRDNYTYTTVKLGNQTWMAENLNYDPGQASWFFASDPVNGDTYGRVYGWKVVDQVCPEGWHVPSDDEWLKLERFLGMDKEELDDYMDRCSGEVSRKMRTKWFPDDQDVNLSGFGALPGGKRLTNGDFSDLGTSSYFWTSTSYLVFSDFEAVFREISRDCIKRNQILGSSMDDLFFQSEAYSIRCIKDKVCPEAR